MRSAMSFIRPTVSPVSSAMVTFIAHASISMDVVFTLHLPQLVEVVFGGLQVQAQRAGMLIQGIRPKLAKANVWSEDSRC